MGDLAAHKRLSVLLSYKLKREYSEMCGFVRARMLLAIVRSNSLLLHGPHNRGARIWQRPELTDGVVMALLAPWRGLIGGKIRDEDREMGSCRRIARERSESVYSWDREGDGTKELDGFRDKAE